MTDHVDDPAHEQECLSELPLHARFLRTGRGRLVEERTVIEALESAEILESQLVPWGSNYTFAVALEIGEPEPFIAIYKPEQGEAPLWDFPIGTLFEREYAAYLLSRFLGWRFVPPTVIREGPHGIGTVQLYIEPEQRSELILDEESFSSQLKQLALFDVIANNADRKASHFFLGKYQRQVWGIDHGLTFNIDPKLRTVIWEFGGEPIPQELCHRLHRIERHQELMFSLLEPYLAPDEILMLLIRAEQILQRGTMPALASRRNIPYGW
ncbi:MAG: SCO1664 family protein [Thermomicrobiaceae bacterium]